MNNASKVALLKLIREHEPISIHEIAILIENNLGLKSDFAYSHLLENIYGYSRHAVEDLFRLGLIRTQDGVEFNPKVKLLTTPILPRLQELFRFSLTTLVKAGENPMQVTPVFRRPISQSSFGDIFVAMPFRNDLKPFYENHILKVTKELGVSCKRGDDFFSANRIMDDIWSAIYHCKLCVADCTDRNPNVFYELGIAHTLGRKAILITQNIDDIPFDVRDLRTIVYTLLEPQSFERTLRSTLIQEMSLDSA